MSSPQEKEPQVSEQKPSSVMAPTILYGSMSWCDFVMEKMDEHHARLTKLEAENAELKAVVRVLCKICGSPAIDKGAMREAWDWLSSHPAEPEKPEMPRKIIDVSAGMKPVTNIPGLCPCGDYPAPACDCEQEPATESKAEPPREPDKSIDDEASGTSRRGGVRKH